MSIDYRHSTQLLILQTMPDITFPITLYQDHTTSVFSNPIGQYHTSIKMMASIVQLNIFILTPTGIFERINNDV